MTISIQPRHASTITPLSVQTAEPTNTPPALPPASNDNAPARTEQPPAGTTLERPFNFKQALGDQQNLKTLGDALAQIASRLGPDASPTAVLSALQTMPIALHPDSAAFANVGENVTLESFIKHLGLRMPHDPFSLTGLSDAVINRSQEHPLGSLDGALGWPVPMSENERKTLHTIGQRLALTEGYRERLLDYLRGHTQLSPETLRDPVSTLNTLLSSPTAQQAGASFRDHMKGVPTDRSAMDYLLAALVLHLDPDAVNAPKRNTVAGFDLVSNQQGKPASEVVSALKAHLSDPLRAGAEMADAATHLLLAARAPVFLIKDIPDSVTYGSPAWVNLAVAAATIEAQTPSRVPNMSFAQVMLEAEGASLANPAVTEDAQRSALIDWGVANGVLNKKDDAQYTSDELTALLNTFNTRQSMMKTATQAFDKELPSRKGMALAELRKRFPGQESMFDKKVITILPHNAVNEFGPHSLLDATMMFADSDSVYTSSDRRIPVAQLNETPGLGVYAAFDSQFKSTIEEKKSAVGTSIKHLIAQLPVQDRKHLEYGKLDFYRTHSTQLGTGFFDKADLPKDPKLLVRSELNGVHTAYEIDFNAGAIRKVPESTATTDSWRTANVEHQRKAFTPAAGAGALNNEQSPPNNTRLDSFASARTQLIADAFVEHINLDDPAIHKQALGHTTADKYRGAANTVGHFMLDLIPFVSTVKSFIKGNIGEGIVDLGLDLFGFLTAGAGTAGKLTKIAGTAVSGATKVARATKVIGGAVFRQLNPVDGVIELVGGGGKLIGKGVSKLAEGVNKLRGATGSYDLLKAASLNNVVVATGSLKVGEQSIDSAAVLKNGKWYAFDADEMRPYGAALEGFTPTKVAVKGELNQSFTDWLYKKLAGDSLSPQGPPTVLGLFVPAEFEATLARVRRPENAIDFDRGYELGRLDEVPGYSSGMNVFELQALVSLPGMSTHDVGTLVRQIERQKIQLIQDGYLLFQRDIQAAGGTVIPMPQEFYLSQTHLASPGECAGMVNTLALAIQSGDETVFLGNLFKAAANTNDPNAARFIRDLRSFQHAVSGHQTFHMGKPSRQIPYHQIASELTNAAPPRTLRIATQDHALLAGVMERNGRPVWFYFDPNFGLAKFDSAEAMEKGLERTLNRGTSPFRHRAYGESQSTPEYQVSYFDTVDMGAYRNRADVTRMASAQL